MINKFQAAAPLGSILQEIAKLPQEQQKKIMTAFGKWAQAKGLNIQQLQGNEQALEQAMGQFLQEVQQAPKARLGAKLNYIRTLKGNAPEGMVVEYYKCGGQTKKRFVKAAGGAKAKDGKKEISDFKKKKACGGMKTKKQEGGELNEPDGKYNNRMFKMVQRGVMNPEIAAMSAREGVKTLKPIVNKDDTVHVNGKPYSITYSDGTKKNPKSPYPKYSNTQYLKDRGTRSDKEAQRRVKKVDRVTKDEEMKCGGKTKKHFFGGILGF